MSQRILNYQFITGVCMVVLFAGCASGPKIVEVTRLLPMSDADTKVTEKGVTINVTPMDHTTLGKYPQLSVQLPGKDKNKPVIVQNVLLGVTFALKITNNTGHILNLAGSLINLTIQGQDFQQLTKDGILQNWSASYAGVNQPVPYQITTTINNNLSFWDESTRIPPGRSKEVFIVFNAGLGKGLGEVGITIYDLVTETDAAGNPTERASFEFAFMEKTETVTVTQ